MTEDFFGKRRFEFTVLDPPTPMGRKRGAFRNATGASFYPERKDVRSVLAIRQAFVKAYPEMEAVGDKESALLISGACRLSVSCFFKAPTALSKKKRLGYWMNPYVMNTKPDLNNVINQICDALTGYCYIDDKLVRLGQCDKYYAIDPEGNDTSPRMWIQVHEC